MFHHVTAVEIIKKDK